jgi:succinate dehydrogenase / fumarate reductase cytochrome b subunit
MTAGKICCTQFWLRKLHSLTGFLFLGYFLCVHVRTQGSYGSPLLRILFLYLPLLFHMLYGLYITYESRPNNLRYAWVRNGMYLAQRATGLLLVPFIAIHLGAMKWGAAYADAAWHKAIWYVGLLAAVLHLSNGLFGTTIDWGVTVGPHSQRAVVALSLLAFFVLAGYGLYTLSSF